ncbi:hypothetical protein QAD02_014079 [Eretmocerus hayati]|uniref:Uncharacterized protein n=1 Tax=Eretmocerus hayati TaxID=131215 RepID=A0ACC2P4H2_9HYME|nr:hypothetical protein QAD02_014079 [Eretmocerus hayati]
MITVIETSSKSDKVHYDTNLKHVNGVIDAGIGETKLNTLLSALKAPTVHNTTFKRIERVVGPVIEEVSQESCVKAIETEKLLTLEYQKQINPAQIDDSCSSTGNSCVLYRSAGADVNGRSLEEKVDLKGTTDTAWTKKGKGHNSLSGKVYA